MSDEFYMAFTLPNIADTSSILGFEIRKDPLLVSKLNFLKEMLHMLNQTIFFHTFVLFEISS